MDDDEEDSNSDQDSDSWNLNYDGFFPHEDDSHSYEDDVGYEDDVDPDDLNYDGFFPHDDPDEEEDVGPEEIGDHWGRGQGARGMLPNLLIAKAGRESVVVDQESTDWVHYGQFHPDDEDNQELLEEGMRQFNLRSVKAGLYIRNRGVHSLWFYFATLSIRPPPLLAIDRDKPDGPKTFQVMVDWRSSNGDTEYYIKEYKAPVGTLHYSRACRVPYNIRDLILWCTQRPEPEAARERFEGVWKDNQKRLLAVSVVNKK